MQHQIGPLLACLSAAVGLFFVSDTAQAADWTISKTSGMVWVVSTKVTRAALGKETALSPGDTLQTGPNGRVLLVRGEETILVAPNTVISLPGKGDQSAATRILQQAGSIAVNVQKRDADHFEVLTPYLVTVVKGTEFVVTLEPEIADVQVISGEVEVAQFKTGHIASVRAGQAVRSQGDLGLRLRGTGIFQLIRKGEPVKAVLQLIHVPKAGLRAPLRKTGQVVRVIGTQLGRSMTKATRAAVSVPSFFGKLFFPTDRRGRR